MGGLADKRYPRHRLQQWNGPLDSRTFIEKGDTVFAAIIGLETFSAKTSGELVQLAEGAAGEVRVTLYEVIETDAPEDHANAA
jgi:hypothetical protein